MQAKRIDRKATARSTDSGFGAFIEEIKNGNVLLMVGHAFESRSNHDIFNGTFYDYILRRLNDDAGTTDLDFSDLSCDNRFLFDMENPNRVKDIHDEIINIIDESEYSADEDVSLGLISLIQTGYFPFVFTTSFSPLVEVAMRKKYGQVRVMNIYDKLNRDISSKEDFCTPTIYYLFGKAEPARDGEAVKKFVATDNDALEVLKKWQLDMGNSALLRYTPDKYILTLGCTQDDWLFRFIWYTLKGDKGNLSKGVIAKYALSDSLSHYLKMNKILIDNDAESLIKRILENLSRIDESRWMSPQKGCDVFISYARDDSAVAEALYNSLSEKGLKVWYDKYDLGGMHGGKFLPIIKESIDTATFFIAILSPTITKQAHVPHVYRQEWNWAEELKMNRTADCRCFATFSDDYDIYERKYADALGWLAESDNYMYSSGNPDFSTWAETLQNRIFALKDHGHHK